MNTPYVFKKCTKCGEWLVACKGNFSKGKNYKFGLSSRCKICDKKYREKNKEHYKECRKKYYETDNGQIVRFNSHHKRRVLSDKQGKGITKEQWREMMMFFDWACAYSGILFYDYKNQTRSVDHIVSINKGGVNNIWNLVPMHTPYNSSKNSKEDVISWYKEQEYFSEERLAKIVEWQQYAYDKWATEEDGELILITDLK